MTTTPAPEPTTPAKATRRPRTPAKSGDPRADRAAVTKSVTTKAAKGKATRLPRTKVTPPNGLKAALIKQGWQVALTRNQALAAYRKQRTLLHGAGPEAYRAAAAKALGIEDEVFEAAFYLSKSTPKAEPEGK